jgi:hypothetical protein
MEVLLLRNPSVSFGCELKEGETGNVSKELGGKLIALGIAIEVEKEPAAKKVSATVKGVSPKPSVADAKPAEVAGEVENTGPIGSKKGNK